MSLFVAVFQALLKVLGMQTCVADFLEETEDDSVEDSGSISEPELVVPDEKRQDLVRIAVTERFLLE